MTEAELLIMIKETIQNTKPKGSTQQWEADLATNMFRKLSPFLLQSYNLFSKFNYTSCGRGGPIL